MPERNYQSSSCRFGFNGKEKDNEVSGNGNQYDYGFRIYNPRLGRFLSVDPLFKGFAMFTPYQFSAGNPIEFFDLDGLEQAKNSPAIDDWMHQQSYSAVDNVGTVQPKPVLVGKQAVFSNDHMIEASVEVKLGDRKGSISLQPNGSYMAGANSKGGEVSIDPNSRNFNFSVEGVPVVSYKEKLEQIPKSVYLFKSSPLPQEIEKIINAF